MGTTFYAEPGAIISGTLKSEDLMLCFQAEIDRLIERDPDRSRRQTCQEALDTIGRRMESCAADNGGRLDRYWESRTADQDIDVMFECLNMYAPDGFYFGAHRDDGACFGFWYHEEM